MIEKKYVVSAIHVAWPAVLESFFISLAGMIDTMMVSSLGSYAVAAVGLTTQPKFIGFSIFIAINIALSALVARRKGEERQRSANETLLSALTISLILCLAVTVAMVAFTEPIMKFAGANADTLDPSSRYFRIIMGGHGLQYHHALHQRCSAGEWKHHHRLHHQPRFQPCEHCL